MKGWEGDDTENLKTQEVLGSEKKGLEEEMKS